MTNTRKRLLREFHPATERRTTPRVPLQNGSGSPVGLVGWPSIQRVPGQYSHRTAESIFFLVSMCFVV